MSNKISCVVTNVQRGYHRFTSALTQPYLRAFRCELTALSKVYNLYFIAYIDTIHIYQPSFPDQGLSDEPELILRPPVTTRSLRNPPGIDPTSPHSINRLHVDFLGQEEIVLVACDDGDVIGYRVHEIQRAIDRQDPVKGKEEKNKENEIRVFLHRNVGHSAWGLAVHRESRLIAISANTHQITVIAYALTNLPNSDAAEPSTGSSVLLNDEVLDFPHPRRRDHVITCTAQSNIPSVSFDNNGSDPAGRWLFSSSIDGRTLLWDLHRPQSPTREIRLGHCVGTADSTKVPPVCICVDRDLCPHAVWSAMFVDPKSFHRTNSSRETFGTKPTRNNHSFWDLTDSIPPQAMMPPYRAGLMYSDEMSLVSDGEEEEIGNENNGISSGSQQSEAMALDSEEEENEAQGTSDPEGELQNAENETDQANPPSQGLFVPEILTHDSSDESDDSNGSDDDDNIELMSAVPWTPGKKPYCETATAGDFSSPSSVSSIIVTKEEVYLFQRPLDPTGDHKDPIITIRKPNLPSGKQQHQADRLCYAAQIPELGIFIVGSPGGRAAIFSLTQTKAVGRQKLVYGFRLDHQLPYYRQMAENPSIGFAHLRLVGIAVGPVQGMLDTLEGEEEGASGREKGARRWRLMLLYHDYTMLSYELGKFSEDGSPSLGDLIV